jgi:hypothetical protein
MTSSAVDRAADGERLVRAHGLYRDLTVALEDRITRLQAETGEEADCTGTRAVVRDHQSALQTLRDIEARLGTGRGTDTGGSTLDLDAARVEIGARLAVWAAAG